MIESNRDYSIAEISVLMLVSIATGLTLWTWTKATGWSAQTVWSATAFSMGYLIIMMAVKLLDRRHGRPGQSFRQILAGSIAVGLVALILPLFWNVIS
jgi:O-antigen/teichoic acid export membrane protein